MADQAEVKVVGDGSQVQSSMEQTARNIDASLQAMRASLEKFGSTNKDTVDKAVRNNADLSRSFLELKGSVSGGFDAIAGVVQRFRGVLAGLSAALAGGFLGREAIGNLIEFRDAVVGLERVFGITAEKATLMSVQLKLAGVSADEFEGMAFKVGRQLKTNADEFDRLGVTVKSANGDFLPMDQILQNIYKRMLDFKVGTDQDMFALTAVGRSSKDFAASMERFNSVSERARQIQHDLGIEMGPVRQAEVAAYKVEVNAFKLVIEEASLRIGEALLPRLIALGEWFVSVGPKAIGATEAFMEGFVVVMGNVGSAAAEMGKTVANALQMIATAVSGDVGEGSEAMSGLTMFKNAMAGLGIVVVTATTGIVGAFTMLLGVASTVFLTLQYLWTTESFEQYAAKLKAKIAEIAQSMDDLGNHALATMDKLAMATAEGGAGGGKRPYATQPGQAAPGGLLKGGTETFRTKPTGGADVADNVVANFRQELEEMKDAQGVFNEFSKSAEADFWIQKLGMLDTNGKNFVKQYNEIYHLIHEAQKADAREQTQNALAEFQVQIDAAKNNKDAQIAAAVARTAMMKAEVGEENSAYKAVLDQELKLRQSWVDREREIMKVHTAMVESSAEFEVQMGEAYLNQDVALRRKSAEQKFAIEKQLEDRLYTIRLGAKQAELATLDSTTVEYARVQKEIQDLEQAHQLKLTQIDMEAEQERKANAIAAADAVENAFGTLLSDITNHTKSVSQAFKDMAASILKSLNDIAAKAIAKQLLGAGTSGGAGLMSIFGGLFSGGIPGFATGTPYVRQDTLAFVHKGERIVPASDNKPGAMGSVLHVSNTFVLPNRIDTRTQDQIAARASIAMHRAAMKDL